MCLNATPWSVVMFFRFVTSGEIRKRSQFFEPFILGLTSSTVEQVCVQIFSSVTFSIWDLRVQIFLSHVSVISYCFFSFKII